MLEPVRPPQKSVADILFEIKDELLAFFETRVRLLRAEFEETARGLKAGIPLVIAAAALLGTAYLLLTAALVILASFAFVNSPFRWLFAFAIIGVLWAVAGIVCIALARNAFARRGTFPRKTLEVLQADGLWHNSEEKRIA